MMAAVRAGHRLGIVVLLGALGAHVTWAARPTIITGAVLGEGLRGLGGARVRVMGEGGCATTTRENGAFELHCAATGVRTLEASFGGLALARIEGVELGPDRLIQLNFLVQPAPAGPPPSHAQTGWWGAPLPNPVVTTWRGRDVTVRALAVVVAVIAFVLGAACLLVVARRLGVQKRALSAGEASELVFNAGKPLVDRLRPIAAVGARGTEWSTSYGAEEMASALAQRRYGLVVASLLGPAVVGLATLGFFVAVLIGQPRYFLALALIVPAGFVVTPVMMLVTSRPSRAR
jgi:hypothetical protein